MKNFISWALATIAIIAIITMSLFIYKLYNEKNIEVQKSSELQAQVSEMQETISNLQGKIDSISNTISDTSSISNTNNETLLNGTYEYKTHKITFTNNNFNAYLDETYSINGSYEIKDSKSIVCTITNYVVDSNTVHNVKSGEKWSITFDIKDAKTIEVTNVDTPDRETEIIIGIHNIFQQNNQFIKK